MMNEENNRKGPGVFYAVVGVATLVVAIIGATFAYFSAQATATGDTITGGTNNDLASALSVTVTRVNKTVTTANSIDLVPANIDGKLESVNNAVKANCEANGYTGCHLYKIEAQSTQSVANASILLSTLTVDSTAKTNWAYAIYTGTDKTAEAIVNTDKLDLADPVDMHGNKALTANTPVTYYLLVYLTNVDEAQNAGDAKDETGTYTGTVTMNAAGGKVSATFSA